MGKNVKLRVYCEKDSKSLPFVFLHLWIDDFSSKQGENKSNHTLYPNMQNLTMHWAIPTISYSKK